MIKNVILDIGQVLADFLADDFICSLGFESVQTQKLINATVGNQKQWDEHDRGVLSDEEFIQQVLAKEPSIEKELRTMFERISDIVVEFDYAADFVRELKQQGYAVYLLSNYGKTTFEAAQERFHFLSYVDGAVISSQVGMIKPEEGIYQYLLTRYRLQPEECVFVDDREINLIPAQKMGMATILFQSLSQAKEELRAL